VRRAAHFTTWSRWAKQSLVDDYGADAGQVTVIHPGATLSAFPTARRERRPEDKLRILFVGGDLERKGGDLLLSAFSESLADICDLHLVTGTAVVPAPGVHVHPGLTPYSPELLRLYAESDVFVLPTRGDCLAVVLGEAMAASLPIITTRVGAHAEAVEHGKSGYLIDVDDGTALREHLFTLARNPALAGRMGQRARAIAEERFDMAKGAATIADTLLRLASAPRQAGTRVAPRAPERAT
jgi:glycosyltransferase involved in cell wall biosynthesis